MNRLLLYLLFMPTLVIAQLHVSSNSFIYLNDTFLYVTQNVSLAPNANLYLRAESQLLQGTMGASTNAGSGIMSTFQEGTSDAYDYNYWCSPVGGATAAVGNENFGIAMLSRPTTNTASTPAIMLSNTAMNGVANPLSIAPRWIYKYISSTLYSEWIPVLSSATIAAGEGFTMKGTGGTDPTLVGGVSNNPGSAQRYDFRGKPNDGTIDINVSNNQFTLTGNPYPSAIDLSAFLTDALYCTGVAYFWEQDRTINSHVITNYQGGYGTFSPISRGGLGVYVPAIFSSFNIDGSELAAVGAGVNYPRLFSPVGQGFMIMGNGAGPTVSMSNNYRVFQRENVLLSVFERSSHIALNSSFLPNIPSVAGFDYTTVSTLPVPQIRFNTLLNNQAVRKTVLAFDPHATDGADHAMDARSSDANLPADFYFVIDESKYVLSVIDFDIDKRIPVGFSGTGANFKLTVSEMLNFTGANQVYIYDKLTSVYHDIKNDFFEITLPAGVINDRFEITFTDELLGINEANQNSIVVFQDNGEQTLRIINRDLANVSSISINDITGKQLYIEADLTTRPHYEVSTATYAEGVYVVRITSGLQDLVQKVIVHRRK